MQGLTAETASLFSGIALPNVTREYPNKMDHVMLSVADVRGPRALHPLFYGSFDWHSCVHSYWLLAPFKVFDPGVTLESGGTDKGPSGEACDVVKLSFKNVGLTPKDIYWLYIDKKSRLVVEWKFVLDGEKKPPTAFAWSDWKKVGPIMLASMRKNLDKPSVIRFDNLKVSTDVDEAALTPPK